VHTEEPKLSKPLAEPETPSDNSVSNEANFLTAILQPSRLYQLKEAQPNRAFPNTVVANTGAFFVSQTRQ